MTGGASSDDVRMALSVLGEIKFTLAQAKGYIRTVSGARKDGGGSIVTDLEERMSEVDALRERLRRRQEHIRNRVADETAERNRTEGQGGYTFNAYPPDGYEGRVIVAASVRLGDHAHVLIDSGWNSPQRGGRPDQIHRGHAGRLVLAWDDWLLLRTVLDADERTRIAEVERPTPGQLWNHTGPGRAL